MKKKLIEVALPLRAINISTAKEKSLRHGHPSTIHRWWSRKPLSAARAVVFASLVDDPSSRPDLFPSETLQNVERQRLFRLIERLVLWENVGNRALLDEALKEISASAGGDLPTIYDPFSGGGSIPLEAQRLGLQAHGSDLNPVAVLISKALVELPPNFVDTYPVNPDSNSVPARRKLLRGIPGLAADIRFYGKWLKDEANARLAHLYPKVRHPDNPGMEYTAIAWLWVRVVPCPNPACRGQVPLLSKAWLSTKAHKKTWVELVLDHKSRTVTFDICSGLPGPEQARRLSAGTAATNEQGKKKKATFCCPFCSSPGNATTVRGEYVDRCANEGTMRSLPLAIAAEGVRGRLYVPFHDKTQLGAVEQADIEVAQGLMHVEPPNEATRGTFASNAQGRYYGFRKYRDYFTNRQLRYLTTVCGLQKALRDRIILDGADERRANALITYLTLVFGRTVDRSSALCVWDASPKMEALRNTFALQGIQMAWDYAEGNPFSQSSGSWMNNVEWVAKVVEKLPGATESHIYQRDIVGDRRKQQRFVIITDPPYYDNIEYSHLSDFFYVWFRPMLIGIYPELFSTLLVPKTNELVASATGHDGDGQLAKESFRRGFQTVFATFREEHDWNYPCVIFYAFKQAEAEEEDDSSENIVVSTGWETMLAGLVEAGFVINGTWPIKSELANRSNARETNSLASSIVLVCRLREIASIASRRDFIKALASELPAALRNLQIGNIAPVDLAQAAIGPGMSVFSRYDRVVEADGTAMDVRTALGIINQTLDQVLSEQDSEFDPYTRWALSWFEQHGFEEDVYGEAEVLATAKALSVSGLVNVGIVHSRAGKVRLLRREELRLDLSAADGSQLPVWEITQKLIRCLDEKGEKETANLKAQIGGVAEIARDLAYRLYTLCERKGWPEEAGYYNSLVVAWPSMASEAFELK